MKRLVSLLFIWLLGLGSYSLKAQELNTSSSLEQHEQKTNHVERINIEIASRDCSEGVSSSSIEQERIYNVVDQMPTFPGGEAMLQKCVNSQVKNPEIVQKQGLQGVVILRFVVREDGSIGDVVVLKSLEKHCDDEAVRVVKSLPRFIPGKHHGKVVKVWYTVPVRFVASTQNERARVKK